MNVSRAVPEAMELLEKPGETGGLGNGHQKPLEGRVVSMKSVSCLGRKRCLKKTKYGFRSVFVSMVFWVV